MAMIEVFCNDRVGKKVRVKCLPEDTIADFKLQLAQQVGTLPSKLVLKKGSHVFADNVTLADYEIHHNSSLELYYA